MRRLVGPVLGLLLVGVPASRAGAQRSPDPPALVLEQPRPNPVLPAALIPFSISPEVCRRDHVPTVTLKVIDGAVQPVATLTLRGQPDQPVDGIRLRCGDFVAVWDGTVNGGKVIAPHGIYFVQLQVDQLPAKAIKFIVPEL